MLVGNSHLHAEKGGNAETFLVFYHHLTRTGLGQLQQCQDFRLGKRRFPQPAQRLWLLPAV